MINSQVRTASLYVLVFPEKKLLKVGKANNVHERGRLLKTSWGAIDYTESYELKAPVTMVFKLEKSLHFLLSNHRADVDCGDGYTEMFELKSLDTVVKHLELFAIPGDSAASNTTSILTKGIVVPSLTRGKQDVVTAKADLSRARVSYIVGCIGVAAWAVYSILRDTRDEISPTIDQMTDLLGMSKETVMRALNTLKEFNLIQVEKAGRRNEYTFPGHLSVAW